MFGYFALCITSFHYFTMNHVISRAGKLKPGMGKFQCVDQDKIKKISDYEYFHQYHGKNGFNS